MTTMYGADADALDATGNLFAARAEQLRRIRRALGAQIHQTPWPGPNGDRFRADWNRRYSGSLALVAAELDAAASRLHENARAQRDTSLVHALAHGLPSTGPWHLHGVDPQMLRLAFPHLLPPAVSRLFTSEGLHALIGAGTWGAALGDAAVVAPVFRSISGAIRSLGGTTLQAVDGGLRISAAGPAVSGLGAVQIGLGALDVGLTAHEYGWTDGRTYVAIGGAVIPTVAGILTGPIGGAIVGAAYSGTGVAVQALDRKIDFSGAFIASTQARTGSIPDYSGWTGPAKYLRDGFANAFSLKAWGIR